MKNSLNHLELNNQLLASLYTKVLVGNINETPLKTVKAAPIKKEPLPAKESNPSGILKFLGNNDKHITILVFYPDVAYLPEDALAFLTRILQACQLNMADIAIVNAAKQPNWNNLLPCISPEKIISFGTPMPTKEMDLFSIENTDNILWLSAPPLSEFITEPDLAKQYKQKLWLCLKQLFQIK
ncbi:MAG: hypothetical protein ABI415_09700 [Flavitalea sp.]